MLVDEGLEVLTAEECRALLSSESVGRIAITIGALPAIFPVNYQVVGGDIVFRTGDGMKHRAALEGNVVAFEVDRVDPAHRSGWSVLVIGFAGLIHGGDDRLEISISPWAGGTRSHLIRVHPEILSGRRIADA